MDEAQCKRDFRFLKPHNHELKDLLNIPEKIITCQRTTCSGIEGICILLKRLAFPCRYTDMVPLFGRNETELCLIFNHILNHVYTNYNHLLHSWVQPFLQPAALQHYADVIHEKGAPLRNCFGFIDGTVIQICRPKTIYQRVVYNGHKRAHALKFQSLALPNGLIANLSGPYEGRRHDSTMLFESNLLNDLRRVAWNGIEPLCIYGDPAYPLSVHLQAPYRAANINNHMNDYNKAMSKVRVTVEWLFANIKNFFKFVDFKKQMKLCLSPVGKLYIVCGLLQNAHTCLYGNEVSQFFDLDPPTLQEYFA